MSKGLQQFGDAKTIEDLRARVQKEFDYAFKQLTTLEGRVSELETKVAELQAKVK